MDLGPEKGKMAKRREFMRSLGVACSDFKVPGGRARTTPNDLASVHPWPDWEEVQEKGEEKELSGAA